MVSEICRDHCRQNRGGAVKVKGLGQDAEALPLDGCHGKKPCPLLANARASGLVRVIAASRWKMERQGRVRRAVSARRPSLRRPPQAAARRSPPWRGDPANPGASAP
jgi:hypothetical protein